MAQLIIESFANGLDLRKSHETAPPGSLRTLRNCFVNDGGEIEKAKAFVRNATLTAYGQTANYKGRITGPHIADVILSDCFFFRHRHNSLPAGWTPGAGTEAAAVILGTSRPARIWAMKSSAAMTDYDGLFRAGGVAHYAGFCHLIESFRSNVATSLDNRHFEIALADDGEPTAESLVSANDNCTTIAVHRDKGLLAHYTTVKISATGDPGDMAGTGSAVIDVRTQSRSVGRILAFGEYYGEFVILGTRGVQFWQMDADPAQNQFLRWAPAQIAGERSVIGYGDGDIVFMGEDGIRSMTARDSSNIATQLDIGSPIDRLVREFLATTEIDAVNGSTLPLAMFCGLNPSVLHPTTGQLWMFAGPEIYVYANHPGAKVRAWSTFDMPQPLEANLSARAGILKSRWCADVVPFCSDVMFRTYADEVFIYGGPDGDAYDTTVAEVVTPHMDLGRPGTLKLWSGIDLTCSGTWTIYVSFDPANIEWEEVAVVVEGSQARLHGVIPIDRTSYHIAIKATCASASAAKLAQIILYHDLEDEK